MQNVEFCVKQHLEMFHIFPLFVMDRTDIVQLCLYTNTVRKYFSFRKQKRKNVTICFTEKNLNIFYLFIIYKYYNIIMELNTMYIYISFKIVL